MRCATQGAVLTLGRSPAWAASLGRAPSILCVRDQCDQTLYASAGHAITTSSHYTCVCSIAAASERVLHLIAQRLDRASSARNKRVLAHILHRMCSYYNSPINMTTATMVQRFSPAMQYNLAPPCRHAALGAPHHSVAPARPSKPSHGMQVVCMAKANARGILRTGERDPRPAALVRRPVARPLLTTAALSPPRRSHAAERARQQPGGYGPQQLPPHPGHQQ